VKWHRAPYYIATQQSALGQERCQVDGIQIVGGHIGIHLRSPDWMDVTHIPSGRRLSYFKSVGAALSFAEQVHTMHDWSSPLIDVPDELVQKILGMARMLSDTAYLPRTVKV
jgi:hypothetical protein